MRYFPFCLLAGLLARASLAQSTQSVARPTPTPIPVEGKLPYSYIAGNRPGSYFHWTARSWTASDKPYIAIRKTIDGQVKAGKAPRALVATYRKQALAHPLDAKAQFKWTYAAALAYKVRWQTGQDESDVITELHDALEKPRNTNSYQYTRLRVLVHQWDTRWTGNLLVRQCAMRLVERDPNDWDVKLAFVGQMSFTR